MIINHGTVVRNQRTMSAYVDDHRYEKARSTFQTHRPAGGLMEPVRGLEPLTFRLQVECATNCATPASIPRIPEAAWPRLGAGQVLPEAGRIGSAVLEEVAARRTRASDSLWWAAVRWSDPGPAAGGGESGSPFGSVLAHAASQWTGCQRERVPPCHGGGRARQSGGPRARPPLWAVTILRAGWSSFAPRHRLSCEERKPSGCRLVS